jgi:hypothetical protein
MRSMHLTFAALLLAWACSPAGPPAPGQAQRALENVNLEPIDVLIAWGSGPDQVGLKPKSSESIGQGPWSMAVERDGGVLVLDSLNGRILRIDSQGHTHVVAHVPWHARSVAAGPAGEVAAWSPVTARVHVFSDGLEEIMDVPRPLMSIRALTIGMSKTVTLYTAYQERFILGSPGLSVGWPQILYTKMEGEYGWDDDHGLQVVLRESRPVIMKAKSFRSGESKAGSMVDLWEIDREVGSARIMGTAKCSIVCLKLETITSENPVAVKKELFCGHVPSRTVMLDETLPENPYPVMNEASMGPGIPVAGAMWPEEEGLRVKTWVLGTREEAAP